MKLFGKTSVAMDLACPRCGVVLEPGFPDEAETARQVASSTAPRVERACESCREVWRIEAGRLAKVDWESYDEIWGQRDVHFDALVEMSGAAPRRLIFTKYFKLGEDPTLKKKAIVLLYFYREGEGRIAALAHPRSRRVWLLQDARLTSA